MAAAEGTGKHTHEHTDDKHEIHIAATMMDKMVQDGLETAFKSDSYVDDMDRRSNDMTLKGRWQAYFVCAALRLGHKLVRFRIEVVL